MKLVNLKCEIKSIISDQPLLIDCRHVCCARVVAKIYGLITLSLATRISLSNIEGVDMGGRGYGNRGCGIGGRGCGIGGRGGGKRE